MAIYKELKRSDEIIYTVPTTGWYQVRATCTMYRTTGQFEMVKNENRWWFQFWKPKLIKREVFECVQEPTSFALKHFEQGEVIKAFGVEPEHLGDTFETHPTQ